MNRTLRFPRAFQLERDHRAIKVLGKQAQDGFAIRVRRVASEVHSLDARVRCEPRGHLARIGALSLHA